MVEGLSADEWQVSASELHRLLIAALLNDSEQAGAAQETLRSRWSVLPPATIEWLMDQAFASCGRARRARSILASEPQLPVAAIEGLIAALGGDSPELADWAALVLRQQSRLPKPQVARLMLAGASTRRPEVAMRAAEAIPRELRSDALDARLAELATHADPFIALRARDLLSGEDQAAAWRAARSRSPVLLSADEQFLVTIASVLSRLPEEQPEALAGAEAVLRSVPLLPIQVVYELIAGISRPSGIVGASAAARVLSALKLLPDDGIACLEEVAVTSPQGFCCVTAARVLLAHGRWTPTVSRTVASFARSARAPVSDVLDAIGLLATRNEATARDRQRLYDVAMTSLDPGTVAVASKAYIMTAQLPPALVDRLASIACLDGSYAADLAVRTLAKQKQLSQRAIAVLEATALSSECDSVIKRDILSSARDGQPSPTTTGIALHLLGDRDADVRATAQAALVTFARQDAGARDGIMKLVAERTRDGMCGTTEPASTDVDAAFEVLWRISEGAPSHAEPREEAADRLMAGYWRAEHWRFSEALMLKLASHRSTARWGLLGMDPETPGD
jgi:hypothetical protein